MNPQEMADYFARLARPRLEELLRLKARHEFDPLPGTENLPFLIDGSRSALLKMVRTSQPYIGIQRFTAEDKVMGFVINPGLLPIAKAITMEARGRKLLVTRRVADSPADEGAVAHLDGFGARLLLRVAPDGRDATITWECLYGAI